MPPSDDTDWTDDERLEEVFAAWAANRTATESRSQAELLEELSERAEPPPHPPGGEWDGPSDDADDVPSPAPEQTRPWARGDDEVIPEGRGRRRWWRRDRG